VSDNPVRTRYIKDSTGKGIEQINENEKGEPGRRLLMGPFGPTEEQIFADRHWYTQEINRYDEKGNVIESLSFDPDGSIYLCFSPQPFVPEHNSSLRNSVLTTLHFAGNGEAAIQTNA